MEFLLQPGVYRTGDASTLLKLLDNMWIKDHSVGAGTLYIISGFANYNGGVRFYDEVHGTTKIDESQEVTMVITLSHSDTARIQAEPGSKAGLGTQYFWLSKGTFDFFPALTIKNTRGTKNTFSCIINMNYIDLNLVQEARVTFEADNNLDFRLGTGAFRYTKKAKENDLALITRLSEYDYEMRIVSTEDKKYTQLSAYATSYIGNYGKRFGYIANSELFNILDK